MAVISKVSLEMIKNVDSVYRSILMRLSISEIFKMISDMAMEN
jgi:hypothetical protein